jgi:hypothetical protein
MLEGVKAPRKGRLDAGRTIMPSPHISIKGFHAGALRRLNPWDTLTRSQK